MALIGIRRTLIRSGRPAFWSPLNDPGLVAWWNPQDTGKITLNSGNVASFIDESNQQTAAQATSAKQPSYSSTINGLAALGATGTQFLNTSSFTQPAAWTVCAVAQPANITGSLGIIGGDNTGARQAQYLVTSSATLQSIAFNTAGGPFTSSASGLTTAAHVVSAIRGATSIMAALDGTNATSTTTSLTPSSFTTPLSLVAVNTSGGSNFNGLIGDVVLTATATTSVKQKCEGFMAWKYALQGNLPGSHPYKSRPPYVSDP